MDLNGMMVLHSQRRKSDDPCAIDHDLLVSVQPADDDTPNLTLTFQHRGALISFAHISADDVSALGQMLMDRAFRANRAFETKFAK